MGNALSKGYSIINTGATRPVLGRGGESVCEGHSRVGIDKRVAAGEDPSTSSCHKAKELRDPTWLPLLFTDCNEDIRIAWAKADTGADANFISASMLEKVGRDPSDEPLPSASSYGSSESYLVKGGLGLKIPTHQSPRPLTIRTFDGTSRPVNRIATLTFRTGDGVYTADFEVISRASDSKGVDAAANNDIDLLIGRDWLLDNHALTLDPVFFRTPVGYKHVLEPVLEANETEQFFELFASSKKGTRGPTTRPLWLIQALERS